VIGAAAQGPAEADADLHDEACVRGLSEAVGECLQLAGTDLDSVDLVICDQTAPEIMRVWSRLNQVPAAKLLLDPQRYQQVFSTAPLFVLSDAVQEGRLRSGQLALLLSCGRGPAWAVAIVRWQGGGLVAC
jgi:3-oxoacyl-[acyl-carrier-protein] synthase-3